MGLQATISKAVDSAFVVVGDLKAEMEFVRVTKSTHDANTLYVDDEETNVTVQVVIGKYKKSQVDNVAIKPNDLKVIVKANELFLNTNDYFHPTVQDKVIYEGKTFDIKDVDTVPGKSIFILQIRANEL